MSYFTGERGGWAKHRKHCRKCGRKLRVKVYPQVSQIGESKSRDRADSGLCYKCYRK